MIALKSVVFPLGAAICALAFLYKLSDLRRDRRDPALTALLVAFLCKGISFSLSTPAVSAWVDATVGVANIGALGIHLFGGVCSSAAILVALVYWVYPTGEAWPRVRTRLMVAAGFALCMVGLWLVANAGSGPRSAHYLLQNAHRPIVAVYLLLYVVAYGAGMAEIARIGLRFAPVAGGRWLRFGLWFTAVGALACIVYCLNRGWAVIAVNVGLAPLNWEAVTPLSNGIGILFLTTGLTMPSWGPRLSAARLWLRDYAAYHRLYPLWRDMHRAMPEIALTPPGSRVADRVSVSNLNYRLYRRVIEIRDGSLALGPYTAEPPATCPDTEADRLRRALRAKLDAAPTVAASADGPRPDQGEDYGSEVDWLTRVAGAYAREGRL